MKKLIVVIGLGMLVVGCGEKTVVNNEVKKVDLGSGYYKLSNEIYFYENKFEDVDINNFEIIEEAYSRDKNHVYSSNLEIIGADPKTFEIVKYPTYSKDKDNVYFRPKKDVYVEKIEQTDPNTFEVLDYPFSKDKNNIYYWQKIIKNTDIESFQILNTSYSKDNRNVYFMEKSIKDSDPKTFEILNNGINYEDEKNYDYQEILTNNYAKDKNNCYKNSKRVPMSECDKITEN